MPPTTKKRGGLAVVNVFDSEPDDSPEAKMVAEAVATGQEIKDLPIEEVAVDPTNRKTKKIDKNSDFVQSFLEKGGQLTPGSVVPLAVYESFGLDVKDIPPGTKYVVIWGNRRRIAVELAGLKTYRAIITDTVPDRQTRLVQRLIENIHREDMNPLDEGRDFQALLDDGWSQRDIARRTKRNQSHISRRVSLLKLPPVGQEAVDDGTLTHDLGYLLTRLASKPKQVADVIAEIRQADESIKAEAKAKAKANGLDEPDWDEARNEAVRKFREIITTHVQAADWQKAIAAKKAELKRAGTELTDDSDVTFANGTRWDHLLRHEDEINQARGKGVAIAHVRSPSVVEWYTTEAPAKPQPSPTPAVPEQRRDEDQAEQPAGEPGGDQAEQPAGTTDAPSPADPPNDEELEAERKRQEQEDEAARQLAEARQQEKEREEHEYRTAIASRAAACVRIAKKQPSRELVVERLARLVLSITADGGGLVYEYEHAAQALTYEWLRAANVIGEDITEHRLFNDPTAVDAKTATRVAYVFDLALHEARLTDSDDGWDEQDAAHIARLTTEAGYQPTEWETRRLPAASTQS